MRVLGLAFCILLVGCARFSTKQTDISSADTNGKPQRTITTKASGFAFFSANSSLANWKATQSDKTQGASVGSLTQNSNAGTNIVNVLNALANVLSALPK